MYDIVINDGGHTTLCIITTVHEPLLTCGMHPLIREKREKSPDPRVFAHFQRFPTDPP
jgi:hypothetical protein